MTSMKKTIIALFFLLTALLPQLAQARHYTVVISLDGYRWDYPEWYDTPFIDFMAEHGVKAGLIPSFPSKTFPNHYTLATGLYPDHHGIVANEFFDTKTGDRFALSDAKQKLDPRYYGGEPVWNTAARQGKRVAVFYWPGSDVKVNGRYPDVYYAYDRKPRLTLDERADGIISQLSLPEKKRPDLIMAYMEQPDGNGHKYGPQSKLTRGAVLYVDSLLQSLYNRMQKLPYHADINLVVLSDHGMAWVPGDHAVKLLPHLKPEWYMAVSGSVPANIYAKEGCKDSIYNALKNVDHISVWKKEDVPAYLHYGSNSRVGDVVVSPDLGYVAYDKPIIAGGTHGFDPLLLDMHALFRAIGPAFSHTEIPHFRNTDIYELICHLVGITPAPNDGDLNEIKEILKP